MARSFSNSFDKFLQSGALLRHKGQWTVIIGPFIRSKSANTSQISIFWPDFYAPEEGELWIGAEEYHLKDSEFIQIIENLYLQRVQKNIKPLSKAPWNEPNIEDFAEAFEVIMDKISGNQINKAVPAVFSRSAQNLSSEDLLSLILSLTKASDSLFVYGFWQNGEGVLGATPEVLFDFEQQKLTTMALAGTYPKSLEISESNKVSPAQLLLSDAKEREEHQLVVSDLSSRLEQFGEVRLKGPFVLELPLLCHLKTEFEVLCSLKPNFLELIFDLHPTPALGVSPRNVGYKWMSEFPGQEGRAGFGAPFAFLEEDRALCLVAIRNVQWNKKEVIIGSGCGVVAASELQREWNELFHKRLSVRKILGLEL